MKYQIVKFYNDKEPVYYEKYKVLPKALLYGELVNQNSLKEIFDEDYGEIDTPAGQIPMGDLMLSYLHDTDIEDFLDYFAEMTADYIEEEPWTYRSEYVDSYQFDKETSIFRYYETENERSEFRKLYSTEYINATCNKMEGAY